MAILTDVRGLFHWSFDSHFSDNEQYWASFHVFISHLYAFFGELSAWSSAYFFQNYLIYFNWRIIIISWWFLPYITRISHRYMCPSHLEHFPHLSPHPVPLGFPRALTLCALLHASDSQWSSSLRMVMHIFQCYSLKWFHPHLFPLSPKVSSLCLCLLCCCACRVSGTVFLNFICMH